MRPPTTPPLCAACQLPETDEVHGENWWAHRFRPPTTEETTVTDRTEPPTGIPADFPLPPWAAKQDEYRRLQLMGVAPEVIAPLLDYVEALNAKKLKIAVEQFTHMLKRGDVTEAHEREHAERYGFPRGVGGPGPMMWKADCEGCTSGQGFPEPELAQFFAVDPAATGAGKYVQVVDMEPHFQTGEIRPTSVHSVVNKQTGEVSKSAGWKKGPAKSTSKARKGQPLVVFTLTDPDQCAAVFARMDVYGGYLYSK